MCRCHEVSGWLSTQAIGEVLYVESVFAPKLLQDRQPVYIGYGFQESLEAMHGVCLLDAEHRRDSLLDALAAASPFLSLALNTRYRCYASFQSLIPHSTSTFKPDT